MWTKGILKRAQNRDEVETIIKYMIEDFPELKKHVNMQFERIKWILDKTNGEKNKVYIWYIQVKFLPYKDKEKILQVSS